MTAGKIRRNTDPKPKKRYEGNGKKTGRKTEKKTGRTKRPAEKKKNNGSEKRKKSLKTDAGRLRPDKKKTVQPELNGLNRDH